MNSGRYWLTRSAENDLADIAKYTLETWGEKQLEIYRHRLENRHNQQALRLSLTAPIQGKFTFNHVNQYINTRPLCHYAMSINISIPVPYANCDTLCPFTIS
jgi:hypothetical protein